MIEKHTGKQPDKPKANVLRWVGKMRKSGAPERFFAGVPSRDLTAEEVNDLDKEIAAALVASGLYQPQTAVKE